jgi:hypothetical protein
MRGLNVMMMLARSGEQVVHIGWQYTNVFGNSQAKKAQFIMKISAYWLGDVISRKHVIRFRQGLLCPVGIFPASTIASK